MDHFIVTYWKLSPPPSRKIITYFPLSSIKFSYFTILPRVFLGEHLLPLIKM